MSHYDSYFAHSQTGGAIADIGRVYKAPHHHFQRGRGIGSVLSGIMRFISPYLISGSKAVGKEVLRSGAEILSDYGTQPIGKSIKQQVKQSMKNLAAKTSSKLKGMSEQTMSGGRIRKRKRKVATPMMGASIKRAKLINDGIIRALEAAETGHVKKQVKRKKAASKKPKVNKKKQGGKKKKQSRIKSDSSTAKKEFMRRYLGQKKKK